MIKWNSIAKDGDPEKEGVYLVCVKHVNYPYNLTVLYFDGNFWVNKGIMPPIKWAEVPQAPE